MRQVESQGSVRVDLLGGTLDIHPMNLIIPNSVTLNVATSLKAKVTIKQSSIEGVTFHSLDYKKSYSYKAKDFIEYLNEDYFKEMSLLASLLIHAVADYRKLDGLEIKISSGAPAGSGLGGSSAMGITFYRAVSKYFQLNFDHDKILKDVMDIEAKVLHCGPTGYQDYYPALFGGVLALHPTPGNIELEQLYSDTLKEFLESSVTLVFSGKSRFSAINNWEVYKAFFDGDSKVRDGLTNIAQLSHLAWKAIREENYSELLELIIQEGTIRKTLFSGIETEQMKNLFEKLKLIDNKIGLKVCGAGGGGCFLVLHPKSKKSDISSCIEASGMQVLDFFIERPL